MKLVQCQIPFRFPANSQPVDVLNYGFRSLGPTFTEAIQELLRRIFPYAYNTVFLGVVLNRVVGI